MPRHEADPKLNKAELMWHPASLLVLWAGLALVLQKLSLPEVAVLAAFLFLFAALFARQRTLRLVWRARWLFLSLGILFLFFTPGEYLPGLVGRLGLTHEGLERATSQMSLLLAMLASLSLLHQRLGTQGLLAGLYCLLPPFAWRRKTLVRLMLVLELVEQEKQLDWRNWLQDQAGLESEMESVRLAVPPLQAKDYFALAASLAVLVVWVVQ